MTAEEIKIRISEIEGLFIDNLPGVWQDSNTPVKLYKDIINPRLEILKEMLKNNDKQK